MGFTLKWFFLPLIFLLFLVTFSCHADIRENINKTWGALLTCFYTSAATPLSFIRSVRSKSMQNGATKNWPTRCNGLHSLSFSRLSIIVCVAIQLDSVYYSKQFIKSASKIYTKLLKWKLFKKSNIISIPSFSYICNYVEAK